MGVVNLFGLGVHTTLETSGPRVKELTTTIQTAWSRCLTPRGGELDSPTLQVCLDDTDDVGADQPPNRDLLRGTDLRKLMQSLTQEITQRSIATQAGRLLMLHASAVTNPKTGASLILVAPGGTGKTTLARKLGVRWGYLTDETAGVREDGTVLPYEKPLSIRRSSESWEKDEVSPDELGLGRPSAIPTVSRIALIRRQPGHGSTSVAEMDVVDALIALAPETSSLSDLPNPLSALATVLDSVSPVLQITYAESDSVQPLFDDLLRGAR